MACQEIKRFFVCLTIILIVSQFYTVQTGSTGTFSPRINNSVELLKECFIPFICRTSHFPSGLQVPAPDSLFEVHFHIGFYGTFVPSILNIGEDCTAHAGTHLCCMLNKEHTQTNESSCWPELSVKMAALFCLRSGVDDVISPEHLAKEFGGTIQVHNVQDTKGERSWYVTFL